MRFGGYAWMGRACVTLYRRTGLLTNDNGRDEMVASVTRVAWVRASAEGKDLHWAQRR